MEPVRIPIEDVLDLHTFQPGEVAELLDAYFEACIEESIFMVRVVHGKGTGALRERVHAVLRKNARVASFRIAPPEAGGWGATLVDLKRHNAPSSVE